MKRYMHYIFEAYRPYALSVLTVALMTSCGQEPLKPPAKTTSKGDSADSTSAEAKKALGSLIAKKREVTEEFSLTQTQDAAERRELKELQDNVKSLSDRKNQLYEECGILKELAQKGEDQKMDTATLDKILATKKTKECQVSLEEVQAIKNRSKENALKEIPVPEKIVPESIESELAKMDPKNAENQKKVQAETDAIKAKTTKLKDEIKKREATLNDLRSQELASSKTLLRDAALGCKSTEVISKFEILTEGAHLEISPSWETDQAVKTQGVPGKIQLTFGENFSHTISDEEASPLFSHNSTIEIPQLQSKKISDFKQLVITKGGNAYASQQKCWQEFLFFKNCAYTNQELQRYQLDEITIKINGDVAYQKKDVHFTFEGKQLEWKDTNIISNPEYLKLMSKTECKSTGDEK